MKHRKSWLMFMAGIAVGALFTLLLTSGAKMGPEELPPAVWNAAEATDGSGGQTADPADSEENAAARASAAKDGAKTGPPAGNDAARPAGNTYALWSAESIYNGGDEVIFENGVYRAKWWTQREEPGRSRDGVWEYLGELPQEDGLQVQRQERPEAEEQAEDQPAADGEAEDRPEADGEAEESPAAEEARKNTAGAAENGLKLVAYYPSWEEGEANLSKLRFDCITHVNYAFAIPTPEGGLRPLEHAEQAEEIVRRAHEAGAKALLAVGGWSYQDVPLEAVFMEATASEAKRERLTEEILELCDAYGFDGVDMDWEHPRVDGASGSQYEEFMLQLAEKLHERKKLLTAAVLPGVTADGLVYYDAAAHTDAVLGAVDWINVMAYDGGDGERHSTYEFAVACAGYWKDARKMPGNKIVLGVPFYARPSWAAYQEILAADPEAWKKDRSNYNGMEAWYNGCGTIRRKAAYAREQLGGIMIWEITQDAAEPAKSLLNAAREGLGL